MNIVIDPISEQLEQFFQSNGVNIILAATREGLPDELVHQTLQEGNLDEEGRRVKATIDHLESLIMEICVKYPLWKLLFLFRKLPTKGYKYLEVVLGSTPMAESIEPIFIESTIFGTNSILKYSPNDHSLTSCLDRFSFTPREQEMEDAIRLMIFSIFHRAMMFRMNSISHLGIQTDGSEIGFARDIQPETGPSQTSRTG